MVSQALYVALLTTSLTILLGMVYWLNSNFEGSNIRWFTFVIATHIGWHVFAILQVFTPAMVYVPGMGIGFRLMIPVFELKYALAWLTGPAWLVFAIHYTNNGHRFTLPKKALVGLLWGVPAFLAVTNHLAFVPWHHAVWANWAVVDVGFPILSAETQSVYPLGALQTFATILIGMGILVWYGLHSRRISRRQVLILAISPIVPIIGNTVARFGVFGLQPSMDIGPMGMVVFNALMIYALFREKMFEVNAISRDHIMGSIEDAIISVDDDLNIVDYNEAADELFSLGGRTGDRLDETLPAMVEETGESTGPTFANEITWVGGGDDRRYLNINVSPFVRNDETRGFTLVIQDVTELRERTHKLEQQTEQLDQFASVVSHDLRNPLTIAYSMAQQLEMTDQDDIGEELQENLDRMEKIIDDALTLAREGQAIEDRSLEPLSSVVYNAWKTSQTKDADLEAEAPDDIDVYTDPDRLQNLFENLFRNAVDHGPEDATIWVGTHEDGFYIEDDGPGIPEDKRDEVFEQGYTTGGTGLGLSIVDQIADAHGWTIRAEEGREGGAKFVVSGVDLVDRDSLGNGTQDADEAAV